MTTWRRRHCLLAALAWGARPTGAWASQGAWAAQTPVTALWPEARLRGQARLRVWGFQVYDARLWAPPVFDPDRWATQPCALELDYLRAFKGTDIAARSLQEMQKQAASPAGLAAQWLQQMTNLFPDVAPGDEITGFWQPGQALRFYLNGRSLGALSGPDLPERFMGIWLSPHTSEPALRAALLGTADTRGAR